jgi:2-oxoacid dehydrogenases acyltransferase (catalytic domain)
MEFPAVNGVIDESTNEIVYRNYVDISVAVASPAGQTNTPTLGLSVISSLHFLLFLLHPFSLTYTLLLSI